VVPQHPQRGDRIGVVLFQLGGPDSLEAVEPFLYNLFSDPDIIDFPFAKLAREPVARLLASRRAKRVWKHYAEIGGKSPLRELTEKQAQALERELRKASLDASVFVAMRYWHPLTAEVVREIQSQSFQELVLLPLYPQYSRTTTGSSLNEWQRHFSVPVAQKPPVKVIRDFHDHRLYLDAVVEKVNAGLQRFPRAKGPAADLPSGPSDLAQGGERKSNRARRPQEGLPGDVHLLFSAHGVPESVIAAGDPYQGQVEATVERVRARGAWANRHSLCYQSRSGPGRWLRPYLDQALRGLAAQGVKRVLVVPISFVSDHVETLYELDREARELAQGFGVREFAVMPALNDSPQFIAALADLVWREVLTVC
jgi:ferrochelatase